jgi:Flp pilus assembly protein TadG
VNRPLADARAAGRAGAIDRGSASVEFALVLPLILTMALVLLQVGLFVKDQLVLQGAARSGAREAAVSTDDGQARQAAVDSAVGLDPSLLVVSVTRDGGSGSAVEVSVVYHAPNSIPIVDWLLPPSVDLSADAVMRQETG